MDSHSFHIFWDSTPELLCISLYFYECNSIILLPVPANSTFQIISGLIISIGQSLTYNHHHRRQQENMKKKSRFCYAANYYEITLYYTINNNNSHGILFWLGQIPSSTGGLSLSQSTNIEFAHSWVRIPPSLLFCLPASGLRMLQKSSQIVLGLCPWSLLSQTITRGGGDPWIRKRWQIIANVLRINWSLL